MFGDLSSEIFSTKRNWLVIEKLTVPILSDGYWIEKLTLTYNKHSIWWFLQASSLDTTIIYNLQYSNGLIPYNVPLLYVGIPILRLISKSPKQAKVAKDSRYDPKNNIVFVARMGLKSKWLPRFTRIAYV